MTVDLERALHDAAASAPVGAWDEARLTSVRGRIRWRRSVQAGVVSVVGAGAAGAFVVGVGPSLMAGLSTVSGSVSGADTAGGAADGADEGHAPAALADRAQVVPEGTVDALRCGTTISAPTRGGTDAGLRFTGPTELGPVSQGGSLTLDATLTNTGDAAVSGSTAREATVLVAQDGVVVAHPTVHRASLALVDLAPGESSVIPTGNLLLSCDGPGDDPSTGIPLPDGTYDVYLAQSFLVPGVGTSELLAGPLTLEIGAR